MDKLFDNFDEAQGYVHRSLSIDLWPTAHAIWLDYEDLLLPPPPGIYLRGATTPAVSAKNPLYWAPHDGNPLPTLINDWSEIFTNPKADILDKNQGVVLRREYAGLFRDHMTLIPGKKVTACRLASELVIDYVYRMTQHEGEHWQSPDLSKYLIPEYLAANPQMNDMEVLWDTAAALVNTLWNFIVGNQTCVFTVRPKPRLGSVTVNMGLDYRILAYYQAREPKDVSG